MSNPQQNNTGFKAAMPVFVKIHVNEHNPLLAVSEDYNTKCRIKTVHYLNNSLKRGLNPERDKMADAFRRFFKNWVKDFNGVVSAFTCVDGQYKCGELTSYFYLVTGDTLANLENIRNKYKIIKKNAEGYKTAELAIGNRDYVADGKKTVQEAFQKFKPDGKHPHALIVHYKPKMQENGKVKDLELVNAEFIPVNNPKRPVLQLDKDAK